MSVNSSLDEIKTSWNQLIEGNHTQSLEQQNAVLRENLNMANTQLNDSLFQRCELTELTQKTSVFLEKLQTSYDLASLFAKKNHTAASKLIQDKENYANPQRIKDLEEKILKYKSDIATITSDRDGLKLEYDTMARQLEEYKFIMENHEENDEDIEDRDRIIEDLTHQLRKLSMDDNEKTMKMEQMITKKKEQMMQLFNKKMSNNEEIMRSTKEKLMNEIAKKQEELDAVHHKCKAVINKYRMMQTQHQQEMDDEKNKHSQLFNRFSIYRADVEEVIQQLKKDNINLEQRRKRTETECKDLRNEYKNVVDENIQYKTKAEEYQNSKVKLNSEYQRKLSETETKYKQKFAELVREKRELGEKNEILSMQNHDYQENLKQYKNLENDLKKYENSESQIIKSLESSENDLRSRLSSMQKEMDNLKKENHNLNRECDNLKQNISELECNVKRLEGADVMVTEIQDRIIEKSDEITRLNKQVESKDEECQALIKERDNFRSNVDELSKENSNLKDQIHDLERNQSDLNVTEKIMYDIVSYKENTERRCDEEVAALQSQIHHSLLEIEHLNDNIDELKQNLRRCKGELTSSRNMQHLLALSLDMTILTEVPINQQKIILQRQRLMQNLVQGKATIKQLGEEVLLLRNKNNKISTELYEKTELYDSQIRKLKKTVMKLQATGDASKILRKMWLAGLDNKQKIQENNISTVTFG
eukprot:TRINITY_DN12101_c0_g1_i1.p1 TRINITY_DN12101_c0_g1~~TRINITY_DN12101_c0_g1_i1.p1  ORF type:complete len:706 (+),score=167.17 TRINITY_DN12101_c0_g1_i1:45-2162(+)